MESSWGIFALTTLLIFEAVCKPFLQNKILSFEQDFGLNTYKSSLTVSGKHDTIDVMFVEKIKDISAALLLSFWWTTYCTYIWSRALYLEYFFNV